jgi:hypothetical protein
MTGPPVPAGSIDAEAEIVGQLGRESNDPAARSAYALRGARMHGPSTIGSRRKDTIAHPGRGPVLALSS